MSCFVPPNIAQFQAQFFRDFPFSPPEVFNQNPPDPELLKKWVFALDVQNAINMADADFNPQYGDNNSLIFLWLAAHYLVESLRASSMGLNSQAKFALESSSVGGVAIGNAVWAWAKDNPQLAKYLLTKHGQNYLALVYPYTIGGGIRTMLSNTTYA
jgi:hypothetical protein